LGFHLSGWKKHRISTDFSEIDGFPDVQQVIELMEDDVCFVLSRIRGIAQENLQSSSDFLRLLLVLSLSSHRQTLTGASEFPRFFSQPRLKSQNLLQSTIISAVN
jgi:hypothetical protein